MLNSRLLNEWIEELKIEQTNYYLEKKVIYNELNEISNSISEKRRTFKNNYYDKNKTFNGLYEELFDYLTAEGIKLDRDHLIKTKDNGTPYSIIYKGEEVHSSNRVLSVYSLVEYYFYKFENKTLFNILDSRKDLKVLAEKEIDLYIKTLLVRIEKKYGAVLSVKDSKLSNVEKVVFECENGSCYLEKILAGGYNIQRLHRRLLLKEVK